MQRARNQRYTDYLFADAVWSGTAPIATYALETFGYLRPDWKVKYGSGTVTLTATLPTPRRGDIFALPQHNLAGAVLTLTNGAGLSQAITLAAVMENNLPLTTVVDLSIGTPVEATRTSNVWNLVIVGNAVNVTLGGLVWVSGPSRTLEHNYNWPFDEREGYGVIEHPNPHLVVPRHPLLSGARQLEVEFQAEDADLASLRSWFRANSGRGYPSFLWPDPDINDALIGVWQQQFHASRDFLGISTVPLTFDELSKGLPIL